MIRIIINVSFLALILLGLAMLFTGCRSVEGDGFSNSGAYRRPAYVKRKSGNIEYWSNQ